MVNPRIDYTTVTEAPGNLVSREALSMLWTRYAFAGEFCSGKTVLEAACGPGPGLGYLAGRARKLVAGDYTADLLKCAKSHYRSQITLVQFDAQHLPFRKEVFDVVILFEAIYFLGDVDAFLRACRYVLKPKGTVIIASVNPAWAAFNPAPFSTKYLTAVEMQQVLSSNGFSVQVFGSFPTADDHWGSRLITLAKRAAVKLKLIPRTMKGKELLKRLAFGKLEPFPEELSPGIGPYCRPLPLSELHAADGFKVLYAVGRRVELQDGCSTLE